MTSGSSSLPPRQRGGVRRRCLVSLLTVLLVGPVSLTAQTDSLARTPSLALHAGLFSIARVEFGNTYGSNAAFLVGGEFCVPVSRSVDLFLSVMRFASSGIPRVKIYAYVNAVLVQVDEISEGEATYRQANIHAGLRFNRQLDEVVAIVGQIGVAAALVREDARLPTGEPLLGYAETGYGFFAGVGLERRFRQAGLALFINGGYDVVRVMLNQRLVEAGGTTVTSGVRKYF